MILVQNDFYKEVTHASSMSIMEWNCASSMYSGILGKKTQGLLWNWITTTSRQNKYGHRYQLITTQY